MSNVLAFPARRPVDRSRNLAALLQGVAGERRALDDVFWLKECAEALSILAAMDEVLDAGQLAAFEAFHAEVEERLRFYPQYYRFFLSMVLDLEDLGMGGAKGQALCEWVVAEGLAEAELSDLQRAEARRLLSRRGAAAPVSEGALGDRLRRFAERPDTFALPNRKAAYELTHIVFYLSDYGRCDPGLGPAAVQSLTFTGLVAYLDQNHDLLAEICTALRFAGVTPSAIWTEAVATAHRSILPMAAAERCREQDGYHAFMVTGWAEAVAGGRSFEADIPEGYLVFRDRWQGRSALRPLSECLLEIGAARSAEWAGMRGRVVPFLDEGARGVLERAEASTGDFEAFFSRFARAAAG